MSATTKKRALLLAGVVLAALTRLPKLAPFVPYIAEVSGLLVGWSGLKRPGDT